MKGEDRRGSRTAQPRAHTHPLSGIATTRAPGSAAAHVSACAYVDRPPAEQPVITTSFASARPSAMRKAIIAFSTRAPRKKMGGAPGATGTASATSPSWDVPSQ